MCSDAVKISLFRAFSTPLYTAHLWTNFKKASMQEDCRKHNALRVLLKARVGDLDGVVPVKCLCLHESTLFKLF